jgi:Kef-type K+ transport system membrane component KefB
MMVGVLSFGTLVVVVLAGLAGPLLGLTPRWFVPVVAGEILAGIIAGPQLTGAVDPANASLSFLGEVGFAMLMLTAGMHLPLRDDRLAASVRGGALTAGLVCLLAVPGGLLAAALAGTGHAAVYAVVLASGSAAVLLPAFEEAKIEGPAALRVMAQVAIADILTIVSIPIVLQPGRAGHAVLGGLLVAAAAALTWALARILAGHPWAHRVRHLSKTRHWALDLRVSLLFLFVLAWLAQQGGTSVLIAGFGAGVTVALIGGPKRLSTQMRGIADGFFIPIYFVILGARLDLGGLFSDPAALGLAAALVALNVVIHLLGAMFTRGPAAGALAASAQLGVPAAVASLGLTEHVLSSVDATAVVAGALVSLAVCTAGVDLMARAEATARRARPTAV